MDHTALWAGFGVIIVVIMALDLGVFQKKSHAMSFKEALFKTVLFVAFALAFNLMIFLKDGHEEGMQFLSGYIIELSLSVDNLFVFMMIFSYFKVPVISQNRVLFWGILGALALRAVFIFVGAALLNQFHWIIYIFGAFLVFTSIKMALQKENTDDPEMNFVVRMIKKIVPVTKDFHGEHFFVKQSQKYFATPLFIVLILVETTDVVFAFDSIPAIFAVTKDPFIVFTSNVFAILGLRALYFCISGFMDKFIYLKPALCVILAFVGIKMLISDFHKIPTEISLMVIVLTLVAAVMASIFKSKSDNKKTAKKNEL